MSTDNEKLISIIIPVYQVKDTLRRCVLSCLNQKYIDEKEVEIVLIDDGSTDGSGKLCDELVSEFSDRDIIVKHTKNFGVSHARNLGIETATGRFVCFVDSDDSLSDLFINDCVKFLDEETLLIVQGESYDTKSKISGYKYLEDSVLCENTHVWGKLFDRKTLIDNKIFFTEGLTIGEDLLFLIDFAISIDSKRAVRLSTTDGYNYSINEESVMNRSFKESYMDQLVCWKKAEEKLLEHAELISPYAFVSLYVSQVLTALLVIGKVACWDKDERDEDIAKLAIAESTKQIKYALKKRGTFAALSFAHKIKVTVLKISPKLYVKMYAKMKG